MRLVLDIRLIGGGVTRWTGDDQETFTVGRGNLDIPLENEPRCSRSHAIFLVDQSGHLCILDLDSTNGTFVDNTRVDSARLTIGSSVLIGDTYLTVVSFDPQGQGSFYIEDNGTRSITVYDWAKGTNDLPNRQLDKSKNQK